MKKSKKIVAYFLVLLMFSTLVPMSFSASADTRVLKYTPKPKIELSYNSSVKTGTIRYVTQSVGNSYFYDAYWGRYKSKAYQECFTACISMAASYTGVNQTPENLADYWISRGYSHPTDIFTTMPGLVPGATYTTSSNLSTAFSNYANGNGKYSPPIIHLPGYSNRGHYVLVIGKISSNVYCTLNPDLNSYNRSRYLNITVNGSRATWSGGSSSIGSICQYYRASASIPKTTVRTTVPTTKKFTLAVPSFSVSTSWKMFTVKYKKVSNATGYYIKINNGKKITTKYYKSSASTTRRYAAKKGTYKIQVRSYCYKNGRAYYSNWSSTKTVKVK